MLQEIEKGETMTSKLQVLQNGNLAALIFLTDNAPGEKCLLAGIIPFDRSGSWATGDFKNITSRGLHSRVLPEGTTEKAAVDAMLTDVGMEPSKCQSFRYQ